VLTAIVGSQYLPDFSNCVLFLEDVEEAPYRIDRMLTQSLAGILEAGARRLGTHRGATPAISACSRFPTSTTSRRFGAPAFHGDDWPRGSAVHAPRGPEVELDATAGTGACSNPRGVSAGRRPSA
jgi:muramoyltetrapeptide carboxypeptidase